MAHQLRRAFPSDASRIWEILQQAILKRKKEGSNQWQDGYPNPEVIKKDISKEIGYVLITNNEIIGYCAVDINNEPAYQKIEGAWQTNGDFVVFHRVAIAKEYIGKGLASTMFKCIEHYALENTINSIKADTNFDNAPMLYLFKKLGYRYCGQVHIRNSPRRAYEKVLNLKQ